MHRSSQVERWVVAAAVLLSGAAGLVYQVAWIRRLTGVTSVAHTAQAVVLAVFMAGLGAGSLAAGTRAKRSPQPLLAYAAVELAAAALALCSIPLIAWSGELRIFWTWLGGSLGAGLWVQLAVVSGFLLAPTTLMGASLPLVIEAVERRGLSAAAASRLMSLLYAVNTLGAAAGCLFAGFVSIELVGLERTTWIGAGCAGGAALLALGFGTRMPSPTAERNHRSTTPGNTPQRVRTSFPARQWWLVAGAAGFIGLAAEVVWTRLISLVVLNTVYAFSQVLASVLVGIGVGALFASLSIRQAHRDAEPKAALQRTAAGALLFAAVLLSLLPLAVLWLAQDRELQMALASGFSPAGNALLAGLLVPPSAAVAALLPLAVALARLECRGAESFACLYAVNTGGGVAGSLAAGFALIPLLGTSGAEFFLTIGALALSAHLLRGARAPWPSAAGWMAGALTSALLFASIDLPRDIYRARLDPDTAILEFRESQHSDVMVTQDPQGRRRLWINSSWVAGTGGGHRSLGHLPALLVEKPRRALGIALGTGQTFAAVFAHGPEVLHCVELDEGVIELSRRWFGEANQHLFERPGVVLHQGDGRAFLRTTDERFDIIVLEPLQAWSAGTSNLYSQEFYREAERVLAPGGVMAQWIPFYGQGVAETRAMIRTARKVFPEASLWLDDHDGILVLQRQPFEIWPPELSRRIRERGIARELARNSLEDIQDLLSLFLMGPHGLERWQLGSQVITDDRPFLEFAAARQLGRHQYRSMLTSILENAEPALLYVGGGDPDARRQAERAAHIRTAVLTERSQPQGRFLERATTLERGLAEMPDSKLLRRRYRNAILEWATGLEAKGRLDEAERVYRRALNHDARLGEAAVNLALLYTRQKRYQLARQTLDRPWPRGPVRDSADRVRSLLDSLPGL